eukprot:1730476-Rhodomonas_salina.2
MQDLKRGSLRSSEVSPDGDGAFGHNTQRACYALSGTNLAHGATRRPVPTYCMLLSPTPPPPMSILCDVRPLHLTPRRFDAGRPYYAKSGTAIALGWYQPAWLVLPWRVRTIGLQACYKSLVLPWRVRTIGLHACYAISGTDAQAVVYQTLGPPNSPFFAPLPGTDLYYGTPLLTYAIVLPGYPVLKYVMGLPGSGGPGAYNGGAPPARKRRSVLAPGQGASLYPIHGGMRCLGIMLRAHYVMSGTDLGYAATRGRGRIREEERKRLCCYACAMRCPVPTYAMLLPGSSGLSVLEASIKLRVSAVLTQRMVLPGDTTGAVRERRHKREGTCYAARKQRETTSQSPHNLYTRNVIDFTVYAMSSADLYCKVRYWT